MQIQVVSAKTWQENVAESDVPIMVNFGATRCGFCNALEPPLWPAV